MELRTDTASSHRLALQRGNMLLFTGLLFPSACYLFYFFLGSPAPPPLMCNYVFTDPPAVGLVNHAHPASCRSPRKEQAVLTRLQPLQMGSSASRSHLAFDCRLAKVSGRGTWAAETPRGTLGSRLTLCGRVRMHTHGHTHSHVPRTQTREPGFVPHRSLTLLSIKPLRAVCAGLQSLHLGSLLWLPPTRQFVRCDHS